MPEVLERQQKLHEDLAALAKGTVLMGRPKRTTAPEYGVIAEQRVHKLDSPGRKLEMAEIYTATRNVTDRRPSEASDTTQTTKHSNASFEIRTCVSTLPVELADFDGSVMPQAVQSLDDSVSNENEPPSHPFQEKAQNVRIVGGVVVIPEPKQRQKREPFAVLHLAEYSSDTKPSPITVKPEEKSEKSRSCDTRSPCTSDSEGSRPKGLMRLRAKAPPPINMSLVNKAHQLEKESFIANTIYDGADSLNSTADSEVDLVRMEGGSTDERGIPNAPMMLSVPLPPVTPIVSRLGLGLRVTGTIPVKPVLMIPTNRRPMMPITPNRQALLDILNGDSSFKRTVNGRKEI